MTNPAPGLHQRFLLESADIRGEVVWLGPLWRELVARRAHPAAVVPLLGEFAVLATVVAAGLKAPGRVVLQVLGEGPVAIAMADCTHDLHLRAMVKPRAGAVLGPAPVRELFEAGRLALTLENHAAGRHYQSIVPLEGETLAACFERYFDLSEQVPTHVWVETTADSTAALVLQKLPTADQKDPAGWARIQQQAARAASPLLAQATPAGQDLSVLVARLFPEEDVRLYAPRVVCDGCTRSEAKVADMLRGLGRSEVDATLAAQGVIEVHDELCNHDYRYTSDDVARIFAP
jgi:molecular chaperone Hsp33